MTRSEKTQLVSVTYQEMTLILSKAAMFGEEKGLEAEEVNSFELDLFSSILIL